MRILYAACGHGLVVWDCVEKVVQTVLKYPACTEGIQKMTCIGQNSIAFLSNCGIFYVMNVKKRMISLHFRHDSFTSFDVDSAGERVALISTDGSAQIYDIKVAIRAQKAYAQERIEQGIEADLVQTSISEVSDAPPEIPFQPLTELENMEFNYNPKPPGPGEHELLKPVYKLAKIDPKSSLMSHSKLK